MGEETPQKRINSNVSIEEAQRRASSDEPLLDEASQELIRRSGGDPAKLDAVMKEAIRTMKPACGDISQTKTP